MGRFQILVVEDEENTASMIREILEGEGYEVHAAGTLKDARREVGRREFDTLLVDRNLPDGDGLDFCAEMRKKPALGAVPILFLSARKKLEDKVAGLRSGGDDYMAKPFNAAELLARVEALLRRSGRLGKPEVVEAGPLRMEPESRTAAVSGKPVKGPSAPARPPCCP